MKFDEQIKEVKNNIQNISQGLIDANKIILESLQSSNIKDMEKAKLCIKNISSKTSKIDNDIIKILALYSPEAVDLRKVIAYLKITNDLLKATSNTRSFIKGFTFAYKSDFQDIISSYVVPMQKSTLRALNISHDMLNNDCSEDLQDMYNDILIQDNKSDDLYSIIEQNLYEYFKDANDFEQLHIMLKTLRKSAKLADRSISIASLLLYVSNGGEIHNL